MRMLLLFLALIYALPLGAQLSREQKLHDFQNLAGTYAKRYAPYEWKRQILGFDLMNIGPWLDRINRSRDDLEVYEIMQEYVASLADTHTNFTVPSTFRADLGIAVDICDGRVLIESINRARLPAAEYPFEVGDELVSLDGKTPEQWITEFSRFRRMGNPRATRRNAADLIVFRPQSVVARAVELGDSATVVIRRASGAEETYTLPWMKAGAPLRVVGPVPSPKLSSSAALSMDYIEPLWDFADRLVHVHAKDVRIDRRRLNQVGILAHPLEYHTPKLPGLGEVNWGRFFSTLGDVGYRGPVCVEVEDRAYEGSLEDRKRSLRQSAAFLKTVMPAS